MVRQNSLENAFRQGTLEGGQATQVFNNTMVSNLQEKSNDRKLSNKINMEAY